MSLPAEAGPDAVKENFIEIPGPLRSFSRMAALAPEMHAEDLLTALARNVVTNGYQAAGSNETLEQTEYLKLVVRYLSQARELDRLGGEKKVIRIETCESTETGDLLRIIGYRMRGGYGWTRRPRSHQRHQTFLTIDSDSLSPNSGNRAPHRQIFLSRLPSRPASRCFESITGVPPRKKPLAEFIDFFLSDPSLCRPRHNKTILKPALDLREEAIPAPRLESLLAHHRSFYGAMFQIRGGKKSHRSRWRALRKKAGPRLAWALPATGAAFFEKPQP